VEGTDWLSIITAGVGLVSAFVSLFLSRSALRGTAAVWRSVADRRALDDGRLLLDEDETEALQRYVAAKGGTGAVDLKDPEQALQFLRYRNAMVHGATEEKLTRIPPEGPRRA
jgi:hypothetical protein